jgi:hypothetical protein
MEKSTKRGKSQSGVVALALALAQALALALAVLPVALIVIDILRFIKYIYLFALAEAVKIL